MTSVPAAVACACGALIRLWSGPSLPAQEISFATVTVAESASGDDKIVADIDGDGYADGVLGGATLAWWRSAGAARTLAGPYPIDTANVEFTTDLAAGDLDGDGDIDLVFADGPGTDNVQWFENPLISPPAGKTGDPTVGSNWTRRLIGSHGTWAHDIEVAAIDGDDLLDVVTCGNGEFRIFFQNGDGSWSPSDFSSFADDGAVVPAAIDGDEDLDLFVAGGWIEQPAADRRNSAAWTFHAITGSDPGDGPAAIALDLNLDQRVDLVTSKQHAAGSFAWFQQPANPTDTAWPRVEIDGATGSHHPRAADFDHDGRLDLMTGLELGEVVVWRISGATPTFSAVPVAVSGGHNAATGDFDGDGRPEIWTADYIGNPPLRIHWNLTCSLFCDGFDADGSSRWSTATP